MVQVKPSAPTTDSNGSDATGTRTTTKKGFMIVTMKSMDAKQAMLDMWRGLKEKHNGVYIGDDLTVCQRKLLYYAKQLTSVVQKAILRNGIVYCELKSGGHAKLQYMYKLEHLCEKNNVQAPIQGI